MPKGFQLWLLAGALIVATAAQTACASSHTSGDTSAQTDRAMQDIVAHGFHIGLWGIDSSAYKADGLPGETVQFLPTTLSGNEDAYWIGSGALDALSQPVVKQLMKQEFVPLLGLGKVLVFVGLDDPNRVRSLFGLAPESASPGTPPPAVVYVWSPPSPPATNGRVEAAIGAVYLPPGADQAAVLREALLQSWYHWGFRDYYFQQAPPAGMGEQWQRAFGPSEYQWVPTGCGGCRLVEYKTGWEHNYPPHDYFGLRLDYLLIGADNHGVDSLHVTSSASQSTPSPLKLASYTPGGARPAGGLPFYGGKVVNSSSFAKNIFDVRWDYDAGLQPAQGESRQHADFIYWAYANSVKLFNDSRAQWAGLSGDVGAASETQINGGQ